MVARILLIRKFTSESLARCAVVAETGFHWRDLPSEPELAAALRAEAFSLVIVDHRAVAGDPLPFVESLRARQRDVPMFLMCGELEFPNVAHAIQLGVKALFHPPLNLATMVERIHGELKAQLGSPCSTRAEDWTELMGNFIEDWSSPAMRLPDMRGNSESGANEFAPVMEGRDRLATEFNTPHDTANGSRMRQNAAGEESEGEMRRLDPVESKLEKESTAVQEARAKADLELVRRERAVAAAEAARKHLAVDQERIAAEQSLIRQARVAIERERAALGKATLTWQAESERCEMEYERIGAEQQKVAADLARREQEMARSEEAWAPKKTALAAEQQTFEADRQAVQQQAAAVTAEKRDLEAKRSQLQQQSSALAERELEARTTAEEEQVQVGQAMEEVTQERAALEILARAQQTETERFNAERELQAAEHKKNVGELAGREEEFHLDCVIVRATHEKTGTELAEREAAVARTEAARQRLEAERKQFEAEHAAMRQAKQEIEEVRTALEKTIQAWQAERARREEDLRTERAAEQVAREKAAADLARREEAVASQEKGLAADKATLAAEREKIEAEAEVQARQAANVDAKMKEIYTWRATLQKQAREQGDSERELTEAREAQTKLRTELAAVAAERKAVEREVAAMAERTREFEARQRQFKEQTQKLLAAI